jgi:prepilin-type N-terminal cleavage/methylation domain-containing protein
MNKKPEIGNPKSEGNPNVRERKPETPRPRSVTFVFRAFDLFRISDFGFRGSPRRGFSLLEVALSSLLVGVVLAAAMRTVGGSVFTQYRVAERITARFLAEGLLTEILGKDYKEAGSTAIGLDAGESSTSKANYDDVDDFHNWSESPPQFADGTAMPDLAGWRRSVEVAYVDPTDLGRTLLSDTGAKRITVTVYHNDVVVAARIAIRTEAP